MPRNKALLVIFVLIAAAVSFWVPFQDWRSDDLRYPEEVLGYPAIVDESHVLSTADRFLLSEELEELWNKHQIATYLIIRDDPLSSPSFELANEPFEIFFNKFPYKKMFDPQRLQAFAFIKNPHTDQWNLFSYHVAASFKGEKSPSRILHKRIETLRNVTSFTVRQALMKHLDKHAKGIEFKKEQAQVHRDFADGWRWFIILGGLACLTACVLSLLLDGKQGFAGRLLLS